MLVAAEKRFAGAPAGIGGKAEGATKKIRGQTSKLSNPAKDSSPPSSTFVPLRNRHSQNPNALSMFCSSPPKMAPPPRLGFSGGSRGRGAKPQTQLFSPTPSQPRCHHTIGEERDEKRKRISLYYKTRKGGGKKNVPSKDIQRCGGTLSRAVEIFARHEAS